MTNLMIGKILLVMLLWAACFPLITVGIEFAPHLTFAGLRALMAGLVLVALAYSQKKRLPKGRRIWILLALIGLGATSFGFLGMFHAAEYVSPGIATVVASTQPLLAAVLAGIILDERLNTRGKVGLGLGFAGIFLIASPQFIFGQQENTAIGYLYIILAALGITASNVLIKMIAGNVNAIMAMGIQMLIGSLPLLLGAVILEDPRDVHWTPEFLIILLILSLFGTALVYWLWISILQKHALSRANAFSFLIPVFGLSMGAAFYNETLGWIEILGVSLAIAGVGLVTRSSR